ncbi:hypothetical protein QR680_018974 [Steinernema hermaphroditum]|uniref:Uncharacterized protein n=1 Tax=Steinernema hermaphroditum TaxID=289476 RepID=A0AA39HJK9_9BILA|nr:hypothetical protein QR680_018974 [Steinernema hermaphroditum]
MDEISEWAIQEYIQEGLQPSLLEQKLDECRRTVDLLKRIDFLLLRYHKSNEQGVQRILRRGGHRFQ